MAMRSTNTMQEGLQRLLSDVAQMATAPDADLQFLTQLQMEITQYLRSGGPAQMNGSGVPPQGAGPGGPPPGMAGQMPGLAVGGPNLDEVSRILQGAGGGQMPGA